MSITRRSFIKTGTVSLAALSLGPSLPGTAATLGSAINESCVWRYVAKPWHPEDLRLALWPAGSTLDRLFPIFVR